MPKERLEGFMSRGQLGHGSRVRGSSSNRGGKVVEVKSPFVTKGFVLQTYWRNPHKQMKRGFSP